MPRVAPKRDLTEVADTIPIQFTVQRQVEARVVEVIAQRFLVWLEIQGFPGGDQRDSDQLALDFTVALLADEA